jgi:hypothetical protein
LWDDGLPNGGLTGTPCSAASERFRGDLDAVIDDDIHDAYAD